MDTSNNQSGFLMPKKKKVGKPNQPKTEEAWIAHYDIYLQLLPKAARESVSELIDQLKECEPNSSASARLITQLNDLRFEKPYNKKWPDWTKGISNITAGTITKVECSQCNVQLIDKIKDNGKLGSRRESIDFLIESFQPIIDAAINSNDIEELPERIKLLDESTDIQDEQIDELKQEILRLNKLVDKLHDEIDACPDITHGIDMGE